MPRRLNTSRRKLDTAIVCGVMILILLVACLMLVRGWRDSVRSEAQYKIATVCTGPEQSGCRREIESVVKDKHTISAPGSTTHYVSLMMPGSNSRLRRADIPVWWEADHSLYGSLKPGDRVRAEEWEGQIVAIRGAHDAALRTEYDPAWTRESCVIFLVEVPLVMILMIYIEYKLIRGIRKERLDRNSAG